MTPSTVCLSFMSHLCKNLSNLGTLGLVPGVELKLKAFLQVSFFNWSAILLARQAALLLLVKLLRCSDLL